MGQFGQFGELILKFDDLRIIITLVLAVTFGDMSYAEMPIV